MKKFFLLIVSTLFILYSHSSAHAALVQYTYDNLSRLTRVDYENGVYISFTYDAIGNITSIVANGDPVKIGDLNHDGNVDLADVILGLQVTTNQELSENVVKEADVNGDGEIGMEEVLHVLRQVKGGH